MSEWEAEISVLTAGKCSVKGFFRRKYAAVSPDLQVFLAAVTYCCHSAGKDVAEYSGIVHIFHRYGEKAKATVKSPRPGWANSQGARRGEAQRGYFRGS